MISPNPPIINPHLNTENATGFVWRGFLRSDPALYSVCIDCTDLADAEIVDGHACHRTSTDVVTTLFSKTDLQNSGHKITITNLVDPRFGVASQITVDSFILVIPAASSSVVSASSSSQSVQTLTASTSLSNTSASSSVVVAMSNGGSPTAAAAYWSKSQSTPGLSKGGIVGAVFAGAFALLSVLAFSWWLLRRKHV
ncbi:hypothetical protein JB92DRAFT_3110790 [Gautieria morchelliformis]|nr:hypothetical protein JB92DRAFT_3110790 [Gautieria morchelliformis]